VVDFRITPHSGFDAPQDALERLLGELPASRGGVRFAKRGAEIKASWLEEVPVSMERDEREEIGRRVVLDLVRAACERTPQLEFDWFAISALD